MTAPVPAPAGTTSTLVLAATGAAPWAALGPVWRGLQADLGLPAPAIAVDGSAGLQLWMRLAQPVPLDEAQIVLTALAARWLADRPPGTVVTAPPRELPLPPREVAPGRWSAWVAHDLAALFEDEPWLDHPPGAQAQRELWARCTPIAPEAWAALRAQCAPVAAPVPPAATPATAPADPRAFLQSVMQDATAPLALRVEAAKALLGRGD